MTSYDDEYMSDEEQNFHAWLSNNISYVNSNKQSIHVMKKLYMAGFSDGFTYKRKIIAEEQLQK